MKRVGLIIKQYFKEQNLQEKSQSMACSGIWHRVTGKNIHRHARPVGFKNGTLFVDVPDSIWLYQLTLLKEKIIADFNAVAAGWEISNIVFRSTGCSPSNKEEDNWAAPPGYNQNYIAGQKKMFSREELDDRDIREIEDITRQVPESLHEQMVRLLGNFYRMQRWRKSSGARPCSYCRSLFFPLTCSPEEETRCPACLREQGNKIKF